MTLDVAGDLDWNEKSWGHEGSDPYDCCAGKNDDGHQSNQWATRSHFGYRYQYEADQQDDGEAQNIYDPP
ncbi:hypothetical protein LTR36_001309 [Oleoguttula mirabilis]|uniref:Uncharacterized protein n=1 Tax=Oleoguttula mirabilis TaxID=1507867 RepID=A0AAV9JNX5_9PEZI|nr:hypothetical protein LTR36_001309 [Oleoguttula mirabilis]